MVDEPPIFCNRCARLLHPGRGDFYVIHIEAVADPSPPEVTEADLQRDPSAEIARLLDQMRDLSEQELMDQVYRRLILYLCRPCYETWIENPTG
ncbi:MAG TPA: hypothetical protein EYP14_01660 [Planctomycetaceae bacterium]|nr:hypothetical protein [Planctomycetaceae bacterium]